MCYVNREITVKVLDVRYKKNDKEDYISLNDLARSQLRVLQQSNSRLLTVREKKTN